jgi:uncharacterized protein
MFELYWWHFPIFFAIGMAVSFCNAIAGGGSMLSLPMLLFFGADVDYANGTNRFAVLLGLGGTLSKFNKEGYLKDRSILLFGIPALLGSVTGTYLVLDLDEGYFRIILALVILFVTIFIFNKNKLSQHSLFETFSPAGGMAVKFIAVFIAGLYGGFVQVGLGYVLIFFYTIAFGKDLVSTNAMKAITALFVIISSVVMFMYNGTVSYVLGMVMGMGNFLGGYLGSLYQIRYGEKWVQRFLLVMGVVMSAKLVYDSMGMLR